MSKNRFASTAVLSALLLVTVACGGDDSSSGTTTSTSASAGSDGGGGSDGQLDGPVRIVQLADIAGENPAAIDDFANGVKMAIDEINEAGGIGGRDVEYERRRGPNDAQGALEAVQRSVESNPTVVIGLTSSAALRAALPVIAQNGVPFVTHAYSGLTADEVDASDDMVIQPSLSADQTMVKNAVDFLVGELGASDIGLMNVDYQLGIDSAAHATELIEDAGAKIFATRSYATDASDLTEQVLAMKGADAVLNIPFPNPLAVQLNQFAQNGLDIPTMTTGANGGIVFSNDLASGQAISQLYASTTCNPLDTATEWADRYEEKFGAEPTSSAAESYDAMMLTAAAIEDAGSLDSEAILEAFRSISFTDGVCLPLYEMEGDAQVMGRGGDIVFYGGAEPETVFESEG